jgi:hypothetical protein
LKKKIVREKSSEGVALNVKGEEKDQKHEDRGSIPKESYHFSLLSNGERNMMREILRVMSQGEYECFHRCQRGRLLES